MRPLARARRTFALGLAFAALAALGASAEDAARSASPPEGPRDAAPGGAVPDPAFRGEAADGDGAPGDAADEEDLLLLEEEYAPALADDPLEDANRALFRANEAVYETVFDPLADLYAFAVPDSVRRSVVRFFANLGEPAAFLNGVLQLNPGYAGRTGARFVVNSTAGVAGIFDVASRLGLEARRTDFGETLGAYGLPEGWYLVLPLLGPSTLRDLVGDVVDSFFHPQLYFLGYTSQALLVTGSGFSQYEAQRDRMDALRDSSLDFYAALRSAYLMQRAAGVREARAESPVLRRLGPDAEEPPAVASPADAAAGPLPTPRVLGSRPAAR